MFSRDRTRGVAPAPEAGPPEQETGKTGLRAAVLALIVLCGFSIYAWQQRSAKQELVPAPVPVEAAPTQAEPGQADGNK